MTTVVSRSFLRILPAALLAVCAAASAWGAPVLMISIDGLKPEYVTHADEHGLKIPTLRRFLAEGTYADGVLAVLPTVTYPDHTTLITGVWPNEHGILNNTLFDPEKKFAGAWYWYASSIKVPTLWDEAHKAGIGTASVSWPVSVNATSVDTLIPEYWRTSSPADGGNAQDTELMVAISRPDGALAEMEQRLGPYMEGNDTSVAGDETRTRFSLDILRRKKPGFMTIHLSSMDESEHLAGPFSEEADKTLEAVDGMMKRLIDAAMENDPQTRVVVVSDHGFTTIHHVVNLGIPFAQAGLIEMGKSASGGMMPGSAQTVTSWKAQIWSTGGLGAVMLHDPADTQTKEQVRALLEKLAVDPANGIERILSADEARQDGGFSGAAFVVAMKPGYVIGPASSGPMYSELTPPRGTHGYLPSFAEMHSSFFMMGHGVARGRDLGTIDMRQIAPTVAGVLGVNLPDAKQTPLNVAP